MIPKNQLRWMIGGLASRILSVGLTAGYPLIGPEFEMDRPVSVPANAQTSPAVAFNGTNYLVAWADTRNSASTGMDIYAVRVSTEGTVLDPAAIAICTATNTQEDPSIAVMGGQYLVVWGDFRNALSDIYGTRVSSAGVVLDVNGIAISTGADSQYYPAAGANGGTYLVVWSDNRLLGSPNSAPNIFGTRVTSAGAVIDINGVVISAAANSQLHPAVASNGTNYLVVWSDFRNSPSTGSDIYGARVSSIGTVIDLAGIPISAGTGSQQNPAVAFNRTNYFVAWEDFRNPGSSDIYGARVTSAGVVSDVGGIRITSASGYESLPALAARRGDYFVAWQDSRNYPTNGLDLYAARVNGNGSIVDSSGLAINTGVLDQQAPKLAFGPPDEFLMVSQGFRNETNRIVGNFFFLNPIIKNITKVGTNWALSWEAETGKNYRVQHNSDLVTTNWSALAGDVTATNEAANKLDNTMEGVLQRFYRVLLLP